MSGAKWAPNEVRFRRFFDAGGPDDCWEWKGARTACGHGKFSHAGQTRRTVSAHRFSYQMFVGPIPEGLVVRHRCDNPPCCNPQHLQLGTQADNVADITARGRRKITTHCKRGHERTVGNTYVMPNGRRKCRHCNSIAAQTYKKRRNS